MHFNINKKIEHKNLLNFEELSNEEFIEKIAILLGNLIIQETEANQDIKNNSKFFYVISKIKCLKKSN